MARRRPFDGAPSIARRARRARRQRRRGAAEHGHPARESGRSKLALCTPSGSGSSPARGSSDDDTHAARRRLHQFSSAPAGAASASAGAAPSLPGRWRLVEAAGRLHASAQRRRRARRGAAAARPGSGRARLRRHVVDAVDYERRRAQQFAAAAALKTRRTPRCRRPAHLQQRRAAPPLGRPTSAAPPSRRLSDDSVTWSKSTSRGAHAAATSS